MKKRFVSICTCAILCGTLVLTGCSADDGAQDLQNNNTEANSSVNTDAKDDADIVTPVPTDVPAAEPTPEVTPEPTPEPTSEPVATQVPESNENQEDEREELPVQLDFVRNMELGWNLGNTFDANSDTNLNVDYETYWVKDKTTPEMFDTLKEAGFKSIRIPVSWHNHVDENFTIDAEWIGRVKEVVDYCIDRDLYVVINTHHDIYKQYIYPSYDCLDNSKKYIETVWKQVADVFADYDEHLLFESMNEPRLKDTADEWNFSGNDKCLEAADCINQLNQLFVDTVRATGGNNSERYLVVPGYCASYQAAIDDSFILPADTTENKLIVEVHGYIPGSFALTAPTDPNSAETFNSMNSVNAGDVNSFLFKLKKYFTDKGIPVIIDEFGARDKNGNTASRADYAGFYVNSAREFGVTCFWWDNNLFSGTGENFGLLNRKENKIQYPEIAKALADNCR